MKKVAISMPLDDVAQNALMEKLKSIPWIKEMDLEFVHIFKEETYPYVMPPTLYPAQEQKIEIKKSLIEIFDNLSKDIPAKSKTSRCLFHTNPKEGMLEYIKESDIDLVICQTRVKRGIRDYFHSSFTEYMIKHAPCDVLTVR